MTQECSSRNECAVKVIHVLLQTTGSLQLSPSSRHEKPCLIWRLHKVEPREWLSMMRPIYMRVFFSSHPTLPPNEMQLKQLFLNFIQNCLFFLFFFLWKIRMDWCWQVKHLETFCKQWGAIGQAFVLPPSASPNGCFQLSQQQSGHFCFSVLIGVEQRELLESSG